MVSTTRDTILSPLLQLAPVELDIETYQYATNKGGQEVTKQSSLRVEPGMILTKTYDKNEISPVYNVAITASNLLFLLYSAYTIYGFEINFFKGDKLNTRTTSHDDHVDSRHYQLKHDCLDNHPSSALWDRERKTCGSIHIDCQESTDRNR